MRNRTAWLWFGGVCLAWILPWLPYWGSVGGGDWDVTAVYAQIAVWWHQQGDWTAAWNPFLCGGYPLFGNPQLPFFHPAMPLFLLFGPAVGFKLMVWLWMAAGFWMALAFFRDLGFDDKTAPVGAGLWSLNGFFVAHLGVMHAHYVSFFLIPGVLWLVRRWIVEGRLSRLAALAVLVVAGSLHSYSFIVYFLPFVPLYFLLELRWSPQRAQGLRLGIPLALVLGLSLAAMGLYLVPVRDYLAQFPRTTPANFENPLKLITFLFVPGSLWRMEFPPWEYQFFLGPLLFWFLVLGIRRWKQAPPGWRPLLAMAVVGTVLSLGSWNAVGSPVPSPLDLLRKAVPLYANVRVPARFLIVALPGALVLALWQWRERGIRTAGLWLVLVPLVGFLWHNNGVQQFKVAAPAPRKAPASLDEEFHWVTSGGGAMLALLDGNTGIDDCYDSTPIPRREGARFSGTLVNAPTGVSWSLTGWGQLRFDVESPLPSATTVEIRFNHHDHWSAQRLSGEGDPPRVASTAFEALRLELPAGSGRYELRFSDPGFVRGLRASALAASLLVLLFAAAGLGRAYRW